MSSIDQRIVEAKFDNKQFESGINQTMSSLQKLKTGLRMAGVTSGLDKVSNRLNVMRIAAVTAIATISHQLTLAGERMVKAFTVQPLIDGMKIYETKLNSIQTIMANTGLHGKQGLDTVTGALDKLNKYSNRTIYSFGEMARNIGTFTAAGVKLNTSVSAIKGIANLAAVSGSNSQQASTAMYQLSQALAAGTVKLMDWNSVVNAGMGGKVFQNALMQTARVHGVAIDAMVKKEGSFRNTLQDGWLSSKILTQTLEQFTGDLTDKQLKAQGYTEKQIRQIQRLAKTAQDAATKVKTFPQLMDVLKETVASGWAKSFEIIIGNINQAKKVFTGINDVIGGFMTNSAKMRNKVLADWAALGGRKMLIDGIKDAFRGLVTILKPIRDGFREIFPAQTGQTLLDLTKRFKDFADSIKIGADTAGRIKDTFAGVFAVFHIAGQVLSAVVSGIKELFSVMAGGGTASGGILGLTGGIGKFLVSLDAMLKRTGVLKSFFSGLADILAIPLKLILGVAKAIGTLFTGFDHHGATQVSDALDSMHNKLNPLGAVIQRIQGWLDKLGHTMANIGQTIGKAMSHIGDAISNAIKPGTFDKTLSVINTGLLGGIVYMLHNFFKGDKTLKLDFGQRGVFSEVGNTLQSVTGTMKAMQTQIKADAMLKIGEALALLTASIFVLSTIDGKKLAKSLAGVAVGFGILQVGLVKLSAALKFSGAAKVALIAPALIALGAALLLLSAAMKVFATFSWEGLTKGFAGLTGSLLIIAGAMRLMPNGVTLTAQAAGLTVLGVALNAIALAMKIFGTMDFIATAKGLTALAGSLLVIAAAMKLMPPTMALQAAGLLVLSAALTPIAAAMKIFGTMDLKATGKALLALAGALAVIAGAIALMPPTMLLQAAGLVAVSVALNLIAGAMKLLGTMGWEDIARGLVALGGALVIIAGGMALMSGALPGAAALLVVSASLAVLTPILVVLGNLNWGTIIKALVTLAATFAILGLAGLALTPVAPALLAIGAALLMMGAGIALAGVGVSALAVGLGILASALESLVHSVIGLGPQLVTAIIKILDAMLTAIIKESPKIAKAIVSMVDAVLKTITGLLKDIVSALDRLLNMLLDLIIKDAPKIGKAALALIQTFLKVLREAVPQAADVALDILVSFLESVAKHMGKITDAGGDVIVAFIKGIAKQSVKITNAAMDAIITFINGLADAIETHIGEFRDAGKHLAFAIADGMTLGLASKAKGVIDKAKGLASSALNGARKILGVFSPSKAFRKIGEWSGIGWILGLQKYSKASNEAGRDMVKAALDGASKEFRDAVKYILKDMPKDFVGGKDEVKNTIENTSNLLHQAAQKSHQDMQQLKQDIKQLKQGRDDDAKSIRDANQSVDEASAKLAKLRASHDENSKAVRQGKQDLQDAQTKLKDAVRTQKEHEQALKDDTAALKQATDEHTRAKIALGAFQDELDKHKTRLIELGKQYDEYSRKIDNAKQKLADAISTQKQYNDQITQQYSSLPDISSDTTVADYTSNLSDQVTNTQTFIDDINKLRDQFHLSDDLYKQLLSKGPAILPFVEELLSGGQAAVDQLNTLTDQLDAEAKALGATASASLYQAGVNAAQSLLDGLKKDQDKIEKHMQHLADIIAKTLRKALKIKSPSKIMDEIGRYTIQGLIDGMAAMDGDIDKQGAQLVNKVNSYIQKLTALLAESEALTPTIAPVLDLSGVKRDLSNVNKIVSTPINIGSSFSSASQAASGVQKNAVAVLEAASVKPVAPIVRDINLTQNNYSPKALSAADIYRNTKNQISVAKGALTNATK